MRGEINEARARRKTSRLTEQALEAPETHSKRDPMKFDELGLSEKVLKAVQASGYDTPTPIQEQAIPYALQGRDVLGIAQTGTGKTAAFTLPMLSMLERGR